MNHWELSRRMYHDAKIDSINGWCVIQKWLRFCGISSIWMAFYRLFVLTKTIWYWTSSRFEQMMKIEKCRAEFSADSIFVRMIQNRERCSNTCWKRVTGRCYCRYCAVLPYYTLVLLSTSLALNKNSLFFFIRIMNSFAFIPKPLSVSRCHGYAKWKK